MPLNSHSLCIFSVGNVEDRLLDDVYGDGVHDTSAIMDDSILDYDVQQSDVISKTTDECIDAHSQSEELVEPSVKAEQLKSSVDVSQNIGNKDNITPNSLTNDAVEENKTMVEEVKCSENVHEKCEIELTINYSSDVGDNKAESTVTSAHQENNSGDGSMSDDMVDSDVDHKTKENQHTVEKVSSQVESNVEDIISEEVGEKAMVKEEETKQKYTPVQQESKQDSFVHEEKNQVDLSEFDTVKDSSSVTQNYTNVSSHKLDETETDVSVSLENKTIVEDPQDKVCSFKASGKTTQSSSDGADNILEDVSSNECIIKDSVKTDQTDSSELIKSKSKESESVNVVPVKSKSEALESKNMEESIVDCREFGFIVPVDLKPDSSNESDDLLDTDNISSLSTNLSSSSTQKVSYAKQLGAPGLQSLIGQLGSKLGVKLDELPDDSLDADDSADDKMSTDSISDYDDEHLTLTKQVGMQSKLFVNI